MFNIRKNNQFFEKVGKNGEEVCIDDELFEIPDSWEWCSLGDLFYCTSGLSYKKNMLNDESDNMVRILRGGNINNEKYEFKDNDLFISSEYVKEELYLTKNTLITPAVSSLEQTGKIARIDQDFDDVVVGGFVLRLHPLFSNDNFSKFYLNILSSEFHRNNCRSITRRSGQAFYNLSRQKLLNLPIVLPPLEEQKRIANKLKELLPHIEQYSIHEEGLIKLNDEFPNKIKDSILQEAIQGKLVPQDSDDEPASVLLEKIRAEKERLVEGKIIKKNKNESFIFKENNHFFEIIGNNEPISIDDEIPFEIPDSWTWCRLEKIAFITKLAGFEYTKYISPNITTKGIPLLKAKYIKGNELLNEFEDYIPKELSDKLLRSKVNKKCILTPYVGASIGNVVCFEGLFEAHLAPNLAKIVMYGNISEKYIVNYIKSPFGYSELTKYLKSTAQPSISMTALRDMLVPLPPLNEQIKIIKKVGELFTLLNI